MKNNRKPASIQFNAQQMINAGLIKGVTDQLTDALNKLSDVLEEHNRVALMRSVMICDAEGPGGLQIDIIQKDYAALLDIIKNGPESDANKP